ncbi:hypothetical protein [Legionella rowbothamii]|uniref:hypothetical protein n=1 Tax=Legionella rowbothamii TaxID=96229 RepID=UPI0010549457|nr:hypothetical protein [Legionella rowbothamii]
MGINDGQAPSEKLHNVKFSGAKRKRSASEGFDRAQYDLKDFGAVVPSLAKSSKHGFLSRKSVPPAPVNSPEPEPCFTRPI